MSPVLPAPVIVVSPTVRAGTTLVQRLLCSAPNTLIYGDTTGQEVEFFARYAAVRGHMLGFQQHLIAPVRQAVLAGDVSDFITPLSPALDAHKNGLRDAALTWLAACEQDAKLAGRTIWGWKQAGPDAMALSMLAAWLPEARWILVMRDLADCFRSAKAARMVQSAADAVQFRQGAEAVQAALVPLAEKALRIEYTEMVADPAGTIERLESFTGARGIQAGVFMTKVNQTGSTDYIPPAILTDEEAAVFADDASGAQPQPSISAV